MDADSIKSVDVAGKQNSVTEKNFDTLSNGSHGDPEKGDAFKVGTTVQLKRNLQSRHLYVHH